MTYMPPFVPEAHESSRDHDAHGWIIAHMIGLIGYCEAAGLAEAERALTEATERLAPIVNGHRLARLRAPRSLPDAPARTGAAARVLSMPAALAGTRHVSG